MGADVGWTGDFSEIPSLSLLTVLRTLGGRGRVLALLTLFILMLDNNNNTEIVSSQPILHQSEFAAYSASSGGCHLTTRVHKREIRIPNWFLCVCAFFLWGGGGFIVHKRGSRTTYPPPFVLPLFSDLFLMFSFEVCPLFRPPIRGSSWVNIIFHRWKKKFHDQ